MFELENITETDEIDDEITLLLNDHKIPNHDHATVRVFLRELYDDRTAFETMVAVFITLYVVKETSNWPTFLTLDNLDRFVNDSVLIMCSEAMFLNSQSWMVSGATGDPYDLLVNFLCFMSEQFIAVFQP